MEFTSDAIAEYAIELSTEQLTDEAIDAAKRLTLDSLSCSLGAYTNPLSKHMRSAYGSPTVAIRRPCSGPENKRCWSTLG